MSRADDLASVFARDPLEPPPFAFRQGTVVTWDLLSGSGSISVGGTVLTDVPFQSTGAIFYLMAGDTVLLLKQGASWFVVGKINSPGGTNGVGRNTQVSLTGSATASNYSLTTAFATKVTLNLAVPAWATVATVDAKLQVIAKNSTAAADFVRAQILMPDAASTNYSSGTVPTLAYGQVTHCMARQVFVTPGGTLTVLGQVATTAAAWAADSANNAYLTCSVVYNSNV